jgi:hypothetical protein
MDSEEASSDESSVSNYMMQSLDFVLDTWCVAEWKESDGLFRHKNYKLFKELFQGGPRRYEERKLEEGDEEDLLTKLKQLTPGEQLNIALYRFEDEYCDQFTFETPFAFAVDQGSVPLVKWLGNKARENLSSEDYDMWINGLHEVMQVVKAEGGVVFSFSFLGSFWGWREWI